LGVEAQEPGGDAGQVIEAQQDRLLPRDRNVAGTECRLGPMLCSGFSAIFTNFFGGKIAFFFKTHAIIFLPKYIGSSNLLENRHFSHF
jgi:hypothetical protein